MIMTQAINSQLPQYPVEPKDDTQIHLLVGLIACWPWLIVWWIKKDKYNEARAAYAWRKRQVDEYYASDEYKTWARNEELRKAAEVAQYVKEHS